MIPHWRLMRTKFPILILVMASIACNFPIKKEFTGISPILTQTAEARFNKPAISTLVDEEFSSASKGFYVIQSGDTLFSLASRYQIPEENIIYQNAIIPNLDELTTLPPGETLFLGINNNSGFENDLLKILPNNYFIFGPTQMDFDLKSYINNSEGWLKTYVDRSGGNAVSGTQIVKGTAENYSISPKVLLALLEFHLHALSDPNLPPSFSLGNTEVIRKTLGKQLSWAANKLNNGYYGWREGVQTQFIVASGQSITPNPATNAASVAFMYYFSQFLSGIELQQAYSGADFISTYENLFGEIDWESDSTYPLLPENLQQPPLDLPLQPKLKWAYTGGPHSGWGIGFPYSAIDFAPPSVSAGCDPSPYWVRSASTGIISRADNGSLVLDIDGDGKSQTGWTILYLHILAGENISTGSMIKKGDLLGHPSCLGGNSSGRNIHIARLYNGEWIPAGGIIPMNLSGWVVSYGEKEYKGSLTKNEIKLNSSSSGEWFSQLPIDD